MLRAILTSDFLSFFYVSILTIFKQIFYFSFLTYDQTTTVYEFYFPLTHDKTTTLYELHSRKIKFITQLAINFHSTKHIFTRGSINFT